MGENQWECPQPQVGRLVGFGRHAGLSKDVCVWHLWGLEELC